MKEFDSEGEELAWFIGLVEGEGSFSVSKPRPRDPRGIATFHVQMTDEDVLISLKEILSSWGILVNNRGPYNGGRTERNGDRFEQTSKGLPYKPYWQIATTRAAYLKTIIDKCYQYFSDKKQSDCDRVLKNLADRGLL